MISKPLCPIMAMLYLIVSSAGLSSRACRAESEARQQNAVASLACITTPRLTCCEAFIADRTASKDWSLVAFWNQALLR